MASIDITTQSGAVGNGDLQLQNGAPMDATLRFVTDAVNTASPLKLSTSLVQTTSTLKITTNDNPYIDAEDGSGNNRFTVGRAPASQQVNVDFASNPAGSTTAVGAIRTFRDGTNLSEAMTFIEDGSVGIGTTAPVGLLDLFKSAAATRLAIRGDAGQNRLISYRTGALQRFGLYVNNTAESGSNVGSDFAIRAYDDAGTLLSTPLFIKRSTGNVGIGTTSPNSKLEISAGTDIYAENITSSSGAATTTGISMGSFVGLPGGSNGSVYIASAHNHSATAQSDMVLYTHTGSALTEKMRITAAGNVGIGTTSPDNTLDLGSPSQGRGLTFDNYSNLFSSYSAGDLVLSNNFYGSTSSDTYLTSTTATFGAAGIRVSATSGTALGGQIQFFANTATAKTAGTAFTPTEICRVTPNGLTFNGDTAAANALDDYEEGTWTPSVTASVTAPTGVTYSFRGGTYTKIGNRIIANCGLFITSVGTGGSGGLQISGLPFTTISYGAYQQPTTKVQGGGWLNPSLAYSSYVYTIDNSNILEFRDGSNVDLAIPYSQLLVGTYMVLTIIYFV